MYLNYKLLDNCSCKAYDYNSLQLIPRLKVFRIQRVLFKENLSSVALKAFIDELFSRHAHADWFHLQVLLPAALHLSLLT